jgi:hypothetical protein
MALPEPGALRKLHVAGRDDKVMSIRAALTTMTWSQYWAGYLSVTPVLGARLIDRLGIERNNVAVFDRSRPESLDRRLEDNLSERLPTRRQHLLARRQKNPYPSISSACYRLHWPQPSPSA